MYTTCCCLGYSVSNVDLSSSLSQLNSLIEFFSRLPVFSVGWTCSSSCFSFSVFLMGFFASFSGSLSGSYSVKLFEDSQHIIAASTFMFLFVELLFLIINSISILSVVSCFDLS